MCRAENGQKVRHVKPCFESKVDQIVLCQNLFSFIFNFLGTEGLQR